MTVSFEDCRRELIDRSQNSANQALQKWKRRPGYETVVEWVTGFEQDYLFDITVSRLREVQQDSEHALETWNRPSRCVQWKTSRARSHWSICFTCALRGSRIFPPGKTGGTGFWREGEQGFILPVKQELSWNAASKSEKTKFRRAIRWRVGKFYYSAFREVEMLTRMREEHGIPLRYHVLANVLLRADFWIGDVILCTYFPNPKYRSGDTGRKPPAERFLGDADPPLEILDVEVERQGFGNFWTLSAESLRDAAREIEDHDSSSEGV